ncbi:MAG: class I SAM-dependent methyltransferase [Marmoricola sp.]|nr:class I SAM-dependent methyltransferase [Marmoricola sp.]
MSTHEHHAHTAEELRDRWTAENWDERYRQKPSLWSGHVNAALEEEAAALTPGTALDLPCGEGGDALWLAEHGWQVEGADVSSVALERGAAQAEARGLADRITWSRRDVLTWRPTEPAYDLVSVTFLHLTPDIRPEVHRALAAAVRPDGSFLVVAHHPSDLETTVGRPPERALFFTPEEVAADLGAGWWVASARVRPKTARDAEDREVTVHDTVLRAVRGG